MRLFSMRSGRALVRLVQVSAALAAAVLIAGCGNSYRPVVTPINGSGPAAQATAYAVVVSAPSKSTGMATIVDWAGDSILAYAPIGPGPLNFALDELGSEGYTVNRDGTLTNFPITTSLQAKSVTYSTVASSSKIVNMMGAPGSNALWTTDLTGNVVDIFSGSPQSFKMSIPVAATPVMVAGSAVASGQREYVIAQNFTDLTGLACNNSPTTQINGTVVPVELSSYTPDTSIAVGKCPVWAVASSDQARLFVLNRGDDTISVINMTRNALDSCTPYQNLVGAWVTCHPTIQLPAGSGPVYAEYNSTKQQLIVSNYDGGTISVIDVPIDIYGNDANTYSNSSCTVSGVNNYANCGSVSGGFGTIHTIKVGNTTKPYPAMVSVLPDGSRAYTANQGDDSGTGNGTVTVVNLSSYTVEKTLTVTGHPRTVVSSQNSTNAKIYASSPDSPYLTIIKDSGTASDQIVNAIPVEGNIVDVRVSSQTGSSGNSLYSSRTPGYGQPCALPPGSAKLASPLTLDSCQQIP